MPDRNHEQIQIWPAAELAAVELELERLKPAPHDFRNTRHDYLAEIEAQRAGGARTAAS